MSAVERVQAAIDKLTEFLDETGWHGWEVQVRDESPYYNGNPRIWRLDTVGDYADTPEGAAQLVPTVILATTEALTRVEADFIVTLRRTADAQLAILTDFLDTLKEMVRPWEPPAGNPTMALADAILGDAS